MIDDAVSISGAIIGSRVAADGTRVALASSAGAHRDGQGMTKPMPPRVAVRLHDVLA